MTAIVGDGTGMERDYDFTSAPHASDLASPESVGRSAGERTVARANPRKVETCKVPVVFDPRVSGSLVGHVVGAVNGASIARKTSFLKDKLGQQLFAKNIRIIDDPLRKRGLRSQTFDAEGVAVKKLAMIDEGVLTTWLLDCATARELGLTTTGHAHRGVSSSPSPGTVQSASRSRHADAGRADRRHQAGILRHRPDRLRRQRRHRRLQPRRLRLLDRERRAHLCRQRGHDRRPSVRDLQVDEAGQRSRVPLRRQCADGAHRGIDAWRTLRERMHDGRRASPDARRGAAAGHGAGGRRARAVDVPHRTEEVDQGRVLAGVGSRHCRQRSARERGCARRRPIMAGCRRRAPTTRCGSAAADLDRRSDRRHPQLSRRP